MKKGRKENGRGSSKNRSVCSSRRDRVLFHWNPIRIRNRWGDHLDRSAGDPMSKLEIAGYGSLLIWVAALAATFWMEWRR